MKKKNIFSIIAGILLGLLAAWWLGLLTVPAASPASPPAAAKPAANPFISNQPITAKTHLAVEAPVLPPVPASQSAPVSTSTLTDTQQTAMEQLRTQARRGKAIVNNLRQLATAASQYMLDKGVRSASYYDLVGTSTDDYIRSINPVMGEDYTGIIVNQTDTQVMVVTPDGTPVVYNM